MVQTLLAFFKCRVCCLLEQQVVDLTLDRNFYRDKLLAVYEAQLAIGVRSAGEQTASPRVHHKPVATHPSASWSAVREQLEKKHSAKSTPEDEKEAYWRAEAARMEQQLPELQVSDAAAIEKELTD